MNIDKSKIKWTRGWKNLPEAWFQIKTPGVTSIISEMVPDPEYEEWVRKVGQEKVDEIMQNAAFRGTAMHFFFLENFIVTLSKTKDPSEALRVTQSISPDLLFKEGVPENKINEGRDLFYKFYYSEFASNYINLVKAELGIYSPTLFYRGLADVVYMDRVFGISVTDFKTSNGFIKKGSVKELKYKYQLGAYANALDEMYKEKNVRVKKASILCVNTKTENLQEVICQGKELEQFKEEFKTLVKEWHMKHNQEYLIS